MADQGVHPAESGFVDDVSPGKFSNFTSIDRSKSRVSMGWWLLRLSAKILALLRLSVNFFQLRLTKKLKINSQFKNNLC